jgi:Fur family ferric uptake transcriptional regulator
VKILSEAVKKIEERLKGTNYKLTDKRYKVLNLLIENSDKHLNAEEVCDIMKKNGLKVGHATVYRALTFLEEVNLIKKFYMEDGCVRYQYVKESEVHDHHHLICEKCNKIIDFNEDLLDDLEDMVFSRYEFKVTNHRLKLIGICKECSKKL